MRECPQCGYKDLPIWRHKRFRLYTAYCHLDELREWDKKLAEQIEKEKDLKIGPYIYHLTKVKYIDRVHEDDSRNGTNYREAEQEKHHCHIFVKNQRRLLEMKKK